MKYSTEMQFTLVIIYSRVCLLLITMLAENILFFNSHKFCSTSTLLGLLGGTLLLRTDDALNIALP